MPRPTASTASLLLNLEGVLTALLAWFVFKENFDARIALGRRSITAGAGGHVFIDFQTEDLGQVLRNLGTAKTGLRRFSSQIAWISSGEGPLGPGLRLGDQELLLQRQVFGKDSSSSAGFQHGTQSGEKM